MVQAELAAVVGLEPTFEDLLPIEFEREHVAGNAELQRVPASTLERQRRGPAPRFGLVGHIIDGQVRRGRATGHPVQSHSLRQKQEDQPIERGMDHHLPGLKAELVGE